MTETAAKFYVELPGDEYGNTAMPRAVVEGHITYGPTPDRPLANPHRPYLTFTAPAEFAAKWQGSYADSFGGFAETAGPARTLTGEEYNALVESIRANTPEAR